MSTVTSDLVSSWSIDGCCITDTFTRVSALYWGESDSGITWQNTVGCSVSNGVGVLAMVPGSTSNGPFVHLDCGEFSDVTVTAQVTYGDPGPYKTVAFGGSYRLDAVEEGIWVELTPGGMFSLSTYEDWDEVAVSVDPYQPFKLRALIEGGYVKGKVWQASDAEPATWDMTWSISVSNMNDGFFCTAYAGWPFTEALTVTFDNIDIDGVNNCASVVDSDLGLSWWISSVDGAVDTDLDASWSISSAVDTDLDVSWLIRGLVDTDLATSWEVTGGVTSALDMSWSIQNALVSDLDTSWVIDVLHSDLGMSWAIVSTATIIVDGQNITTYCDIKRSVFEMHAGPLAGTAKIYVKDVGHTVSIATGSEITLDVHGVRQWGGYVMSITREFAFPVDDTAVPADTPRYFVLDCADYNILFSKRFIVNKADETARVPKYPAGKHDDVIVHDLVANYLNLEGDGLTHTQVYHVGTPQEDNPGSPAVPGMDWATAMKNTALLPGAIFYIDADKDLVYADVDVANAPFALSDEPNDTTSFGYRDMSIVEDGTMLANDAFVWGTGLGQDSMTFKRYEDETSQSEHGVWQWADYRQDLYKPQSVLKRATTYVDGSTQNNRGHKDPAVTIRCTTSKPGLRAGMKVHFICGIHGYDDIIPIRSMNIRFVNSTDAVYQLVLAHYLDEAWNTAEFPPLKGEPEQDRHCEQPVCTDGTDGTEFAYDVFDRPFQYGWGTATIGAVWSSYGPGGAAWQVQDNHGWGYQSGASNSSGQAEIRSPSGSNLYDYIPDDWVMTAKFKIADKPQPYTNQFSQYLNHYASTSIRLRDATGDQIIGFEIRNPYESYTDTITFIRKDRATTNAIQHFWTEGQWYWVKWERSDGGATNKVQIWPDGSAEPSGWLIEENGDTPFTPIQVGIARVGPLILANDDSSTTPFEEWWDSIDFDYTGKPGTSFCYLSRPYSPGSLTAIAANHGDPVTVTEVDPAAGILSWDPPGDVIVCFLDTDSDTPPGGYDGGPVYRPRHVRQLGWGTPLDGENCTMASACIALDRHTMGAKTATPPQMRAAQLDQVGGTDLNDARYAWLHGWSETLSVSYGISWSSFVARVSGGRGAILQGIYSQIPNAYSAQPSFDGGHAMYVNEFREDGDALVYDPLAGGPIWMPASILQDYAEAWGGGNCAAAFTRVTG